MTGTLKHSGRRAADKAGAGRQEMWQTIKRLPDRFTISDIIASTGLVRSTVSRYLKGLTEAGYLGFEEGAPGQPGHWRLLKDIGHHAPRVRQDGTRVTQGAAYGQLWLAMCALRDFDFRDLIHNASIEIPETTARDYCKRLLAAGYLKVLTKANPAAGRIARYRLIRASGPKAPQVQRVRQVYDPNDGAIYPAEASL